MVIVLGGHGGVMSSTQSI